MVALNNLALVCEAGGEIDRALALTQQALTLCAAYGDRHREAALHNHLTDLLHAVNRSDEAMAHLMDNSNRIQTTASKGWPIPYVRVF